MAMSPPFKTTSSQDNLQERRYAGAKFMTPPPPGALPPPCFSDEATFSDVASSLNSQPPVYMTPSFSPMQSNTNTNISHYKTIFAEQRSSPTKPRISSPNMILPYS
jgi:hypothetical protein